MGGDPAAGAPATTAVSGSSAADINQIPVALIERVDVLTGGAASTYGADAVAGVVNFVMNDHFEGVRIDANAGIFNHSNHEGWIDPLLQCEGLPCSHRHQLGRRKQRSDIDHGPQLRRRCRQFRRISRLSAHESPSRRTPAIMRPVCWTTNWI